MITKLNTTTEYPCCEKEENLKRIFLLKDGLISVTLFCEKCGHLFIKIAQTPTFGEDPKTLKPFNLFGNDTEKNIPKGLLDLAKKLNNSIDYLAIVDGDIKDYEGILTLMNSQRLLDGKNPITVLTIE